MRRLRRFATLLILPLGLQLGLSARGIACMGQRTGDSSSSQSMTGMAGMDVPHSRPENAANNPAPSNHSDQSPQAPCNRPFGTNDCQPLAVCASGVVVPAPLTGPVVAAKAHTVITLVVLAPASRTTPPDLPPPRA